jgi:hypothetical protein
LVKSRSPFCLRIDARSMVLYIGELTTENERQRCVLLYLVSFS